MNKMQVASSAIAIALLVSVIPNVYAQSITELPPPGATPDSFIYGFKRAFEGLELAFAFNENDKVTKHIKFAELRLSEAKTLAENGMPSLVDDLTKNYETQISNANQIANSAADASDRESLSELVAVATSKHLEILDKVKEMVPEKAKDKISFAKEKSLKGSVEALKNLARENPQRSAEIVNAMAEDRANAASLSSQRGDAADVQEDIAEFEQVNQVGLEIASIAQQLGKGESTVQELVSKAQAIHTTVLQNVMEKVPQQAKSSVQTAIENSQRSAETVSKKIDLPQEATSIVDDDKPDSSDSSEQKDETTKETEDEKESESKSQNSKQKDKGMKTAEEKRQQAEERKP